MDDPNHGPTTVPEPDDLQFEVSSLAPDRPFIAPAALGSSGKRDRVARLAFAAGAVLLALAVVFAGISSYRAIIASARPTPTAVVGSVSSSVVISSSLGEPDATPTSVPNCHGNTFEAFSTAFGPGIGVYGLDVWFLGFDGPQANLHLARSTSTQHGLQKQLTLVAGPDIEEALTLSAQSIGGPGDGPLWLSASGPDEAAHTLTFNPHGATASPGGWKSWPFQLYIPAGGCYVLQVRFFNLTTGTLFSAGP
jgi:hypothetical protein